MLFKYFSHDNSPCVISCMSERFIKSQLVWFPFQTMSAPKPNSFIEISI